MTSTSLIDDGRDFYAGIRGLPAPQKYSAYSGRSLDSDFDRTCLLPARFERPLCSGFYRVKRHLREDSMHQREGFSYQAYAEL